jgi:hypothetical protein
VEAKAEGVRFGPKPLLTLEVVQKIKELRSDGATVPEIMRVERDNRTPSTRPGPRA